jgi:hypothetical protein
MNARNCVRLVFEVCAGDRRREVALPISILDADYDHRHRAPDVHELIQRRTDMMKVRLAIEQDDDRIALLGKIVAARLVYEVLARLFQDLRFDLVAMADRHRLAGWLLRRARDHHHRQRQAQAQRNPCAESHAFHP